MHEDMYFVIRNHAIMLDEAGTAVICDVNQDGSIDLESFDLIDWLDLLPDEYHLYKTCVDFLQQNSFPSLYIK